VLPPSTNPVLSSIRRRVITAVAGLVCVCAVSASVGMSSSLAASPSTVPATSTTTPTTTTTTSVQSGGTDAAATQPPIATSTSATTTISATSATGSATSAAGSATSTTGASTTTVAGSSTSVGAGPVTTVEAAPFSPGRTLRVGMKGDDVLALERRLDLLKFEVGEIDGKFDFETWQGVMAFQKLNGLKRTAKFDVKTQELFAKATTPGGIIPNGGLPRVEIDLSRQVLLYFDKYGLAKVLSISSGNNKKYCSISKKSGQQVCGTATTPRGNFKIQRRFKGKRESDLGTLVNPIYFTGGFAIHGSPSVPAGPASHGCVRVTNKVSEWVFNNIKDGTPVYLFD
jgi:lipoprotein-anchoring transpeptidase ErfK/SrfK